MYIAQKMTNFAWELRKELGLGDSGLFSHFFLFGFETVRSMEKLRMHREDTVCHLPGPSSPVTASGSDRNTYKTPEELER